jgi:glycosyltransferase involved in cell wall biosynthesis
MRVSVVLWDGNVGGGEKVTAELAGALRRQGVEATVVFVRDPASLAVDLERLDVPYVSFGARRVEQVLWRPRRFARLVREHGPDGALLPAVGHQAPALRLGGYRAPVVAMEHGFLMMIDHMAPHWRAARRLERRLSTPFVDAEVAVSAFMHAAVMRGVHPRRVELITNGIDVTRFDGTPKKPEAHCVVGAATRFVPGKGLDVLLRAFAKLAQQTPAASLRIAGDGPQRPQIGALVEELGLRDRVELAGVVDDMPAFWRGVDLAVMPSTARESFGMVALEAMASARPVVATRNGGAEEVVEDGATGALIPRGDAGALAEAMHAYAIDAERRRAHGAAGRARCKALFGIADCARAYTALLAEIGVKRGAAGDVRRDASIARA